jgi:coenzyme F420 hydrogenase subunit beta
VSGGRTTDPAESNAGWPGSPPTLWGNRAPTGPSFEDMALTTPSEILARTVIAKNYCIGCGACTAVRESPFETGLNEYGLVEARPKAGYESLSVRANTLGVCPFSETSVDETTLASALFPSVPFHSEFLGSYIAAYVGHVTSPQLRKRASSGGLGRWLGAELLRRDEVDYVVHVVPQHPKEPGDPLYQYQIDSDPETVLASARSAYHPVSLAEALAFIRGNEGRYLVTAVPCFVNGLRLLARQDQLFAERISYIVGLVCGGMKSRAYAEAIAWEQGVEPEALEAIDFRWKYADKPAHFKGNAVRSSRGEERLRSSKELFVTDYGMGFFKPKACDFCDDVVGELADASVGDAWLPRYVLDPRGTSLLITRNKEIEAVVRSGIESGELHLGPISEKMVIRSQSGAFRHRREGLAYRLMKQREAGAWCPPKRVKPDDSISARRAKIYDLRAEISEKSHVAFLEAKASGDFGLFITRLTPLVTAYRRSYGRGAVVRLFSRGSNLVVSIRFSLGRLLRRVKGA